MYTNILIPTDGSELSSKAVHHGIALAGRIGARPPADGPAISCLKTARRCWKIHALIQHACRSTPIRPLAPSRAQRRN